MPATVRAAKVDIGADAVARTAIVVVARDRTITLERVAPEVIDRVIGPANAPVTVAATVRTARLTADLTQHRTMRPPLKAPQRSEWQTASSGRARIVLTATTRIAASAARPSSVQVRIAPTAIVPANIAQASLARANVGQASIGRVSIAQPRPGTASIAHLNIAASTAATAGVIIARPAKPTDTALIGTTHRPDVTVTKPAARNAKPGTHRGSRIMSAAAKAVPLGTAATRRSS